MLTEMTVTSPYPKRFGGYTYKLPKLSEVVWRFNKVRADEGNYML